MISHAHFVSAGDLTHKVGLDQTDLVFGAREGALVGLCMQDYNCLGAEATICVSILPEI